MLINIQGTWINPEKVIAVHVGPDDDNFSVHVDCNNCAKEFNFWSDPDGWDVDSVAEAVNR